MRKYSLGGPPSCSVFSLSVLINGFWDLQNKRCDRDSGMEFRKHGCQSIPSSTIQLHKHNAYLRGGGGHGGPCPLPLNLTFTRGAPPDIMGQTTYCITLLPPLYESPPTMHGSDFDENKTKKKTVQLLTCYFNIYIFFIYLISESKKGSKIKREKNSL